VLGNRNDKVIWVDVEEQRIIRKEDNIKEVRRAFRLSYSPSFEVELLCRGARFEGDGH